MTVSLWRAFLVLLLMRQLIVAGVNGILGTYCKGAVDKKGDKILEGPLPPPPSSQRISMLLFSVSRVVFQSARKNFYRRDPTYRDYK